MRAESPELPTVRDAPAAGASCVASGAAEPEPRVTVLTPVYNGGRFLRECIESVLTQDYDNWEYIIVNNRSEDDTRTIAQHYADRDPRIRILDNDVLVDAIANHNIAFAALDDSSVYTKVLQADDWLYPRCLSEMVRVAEADQRVGVVGAYTLVGSRIRCQGLAYPATHVPGAEVARQTLLGAYYLFWSPSSLLIRSDIIRNGMPFYASGRISTDLDALYKVFDQWDFGFVHQVLSYARVHEGSQTAKDAKGAHAQKLSKLDLLNRYGSRYLAPAELETRVGEVKAEYYTWLGKSVFDRRSRDFWSFQREEFERLGGDYSMWRVLGATLREFRSKPARSVRRYLRSS